jgi:hypothetical protein
MYRNSEEGFELIVPYIVSCKIRALRTVEKLSNGDCGSIWKLAAKVVFMWLLLTFVWSLYISALLACLLEAAG